MRSSILSGLLSLAAGAGDGGLKGAERVVGGDVPVAAADDGRASLMQAACGVDVAVALRPEIGLERPFGRRLALGPFELKVGDHAELLEAREVGRIDELQMGDLVAVVPVSIRRAGGRKRIEARAHGTVADGMDVHGETRRVELLHQPGEALGIEIKLAGCLGRFAVGVEIGRQQRRGLRRVLHHPVGEHLDHT